MQITETEKKEKTSIQLSDDLESFFSNHIIAQIFIDADFLLRKFTVRAQKLFNLTEDQIGLHFDEFSNKIGIEELKENIQQVLHSKHEQELEIESGNEKWYQVNIAPYTAGNQEEVKGAILTFIDVTERIEYLNELENLNEDHEKFISSVSRDLREPLLNITLLIQDLEDYQKEMTDKIFSTMKKINTSVNEVSNFILDITDLIRCEQSQEEVQKVDLEKILEEVKLILKKKISETDANIIIDLETPQIAFPRKKLRSILYTLVCNAIKYKSPHRTPEIVIKSKTANNHVHLSVEDNGLGIARDEQEKIFQSKKKSPSSNKGPGVGLYMVKKMITNRNGKIELMSTPGEGSTFYIYLKNDHHQRDTAEIN